MVKMRSFLTFLALYLVNLASSQTVTSSWGPFYLPNNTARIITITFGGLTSGVGQELFFMNIDVDGDYWFGIGFSESGIIPGEMLGTDAWVYGDYGDGYPGEVFEYNLGSNNLGFRDTIDDLVNLALNSFQSFHSIHIERALDTGNKDDYTILLSGELCFIYAIGNDYHVTSGHGLGPNQGEFCVILGGTTQPPTPAPTFNPTPAPTTAPTTASPTVPGETLSPSKTPTTRPTDQPTANNPTVMTNMPSPEPTNRPTENGLITDSPTSITFGDPTIAPTLEEDSKKSKSSNGLPISRFWLYIILSIIGFCCCVICIGAAFYTDKRRREKRQAQMEERKKNLIEVEQMKEELGLVTYDEGNKADNDEEDTYDDEMDYSDKEVNAISDEEDENYYSDEDIDLPKPTPGGYGSSGSEDNNNNNNNNNGYNNNGKSKREPKEPTTNNKPVTTEITNDDYYNNDDDDLNTDNYVDKGEEDEPSYEKPKPKLEDQDTVPLHAPNNERPSRKKKKPKKKKTKKKKEVQRRDNRSRIQSNKKSSKKKNNNNKNDRKKQLRSRRSVANLNKNKNKNVNKNDYSDSDEYNRDKRYNVEYQDKNEVDDYRAKLKNLRKNRQRNNRRGGNKKFQSNKRRGKFGGDDF